MSDNRKFERSARTWLEIGPTDPPERVIENALLAIETTSQERDIRFPWRVTQMNQTARLLGAAAMLIGIVVGGIALLGRPASNVAAPGGPSPSASVASPRVAATGTPDASSAADSPLIGYWTTGPTTCPQQNAALTKAGFTSAQLQRDGWDEATCGGMKAGSTFRIRLTDTSLVVYQDGKIGWDGPYRVVDSQTFYAGDTGNLYITYGYAIAGDKLTIDMAKDDFPSVSVAELLGERIAQTVIYETAPFTREP